jgi:hypothetical protein
MVASAEFAGTDALLKDSPSPKSDLDSLGQIMIWLVTGKLPWEYNRNNLKALAEEKDEWRSKPYNKRPGLGALKNSKAFEKYLEYVEKLNSTDRDDINYNYLRNLWDVEEDVEEDVVEEDVVEEEVIRKQVPSSQKAKKPKKKKGCTEDECRRLDPPKLCNTKTGRCIKDTPTNRKKIAQQ